MAGHPDLPGTLHEQRILDSDRCLCDVTQLIRARTPLSHWPDHLRLAMERALSDVSSENRISAYRADALRRYLTRMCLLDGRDHSKPENPDGVEMDIVLVEYAKDRLLADLLPTIARETAHDRSA